MRLSVITLHAYRAGLGQATRWVVVDNLATAFANVTARNPSFRQLRGGIAFLYYHASGHIGVPCLNAAECNHYACLVPVTNDWDAEQAAAPSEQAAAPSEQAAAPSEQAAAPSEQAAAPSEQAAAPYHQAAAPSEHAVAGF
eukprot:GHVU01190697.1.p1 GENE.GHVU01190697.1~~GHVU01190697.1.p1  ORF type:complete len:141 (-),score=6.46 GHVU01190697.1:78-500(-)